MRMSESYYKQVEPQQKIFPESHVEIFFKCVPTKVVTSFLPYVLDTGPRGRLSPNLHMIKIATPNLLCNKNLFKEQPQVV